MNIKQQEDKMQRSYLTSFNKETLSIDKANDKILVAAFTNGLQKGKFLFSLYKNDLKTMFDVLYRATKYMNAEDALLAREEKPRKNERQEDTQQDRGWKMAQIGEWREDRRSKPLTGKFTSFTSLTAPIDQVLMQIKDEEALMFPDKLKGDPIRRCSKAAPPAWQRTSCQPKSRRLQYAPGSGRQRQFSRNPVLPGFPVDED